MAQPLALALVALPADVLTRVLNVLSLAIMGDVSCTCSRLRTLMTETPPVWQAAAAREHSSLHPVCACADVPAYLQRQHKLRGDIAARRCQVVRAHESPADALSYSHSPSLLKYAMRAQADSELLEVHSALTGQLLCTFPVPAAARGGTVHSWDPNSSHFLYRFGTA